jgi:hypothetical protein
VNDVRIRYRRSGGFAGIELAAETMAGELPGEDASVAARLLHEATPAAAPAGGHPDGFSYELQIDDGTHQRTFNWAEHQVPDQVRGLLATLHQRAAPARRA